jgi:hypothetical protein
VARRTAPRAVSGIQNGAGGPRADAALAKRVGTCFGGDDGCGLRATGTVAGVHDANGGAPTGRHMTQSSVWPCMPVGAPSGLSPFDPATNLTLPAALQISVSACGLTTGAATATPMDNANHTNIQWTMERASRRDWRVGMGRDYGLAPLSLRNTPGEYLMVVMDFSISKQVLGYVAAPTCLLSGNRRRGRSPLRGVCGAPGPCSYRLLAASLSPNPISAKPANRVAILRAEGRAFKRAATTLPTRTSPVW